MSATRELIDCIVLSISCCEIPQIVLFTLSQNCSYDSRVMPFSNASFANFLEAMWNMFSIGFKSGLRGGIFKSSQWQRAIASRAALLFCEGSPSYSHSRLNPLHDRSNIALKCWSIKDAKWFPSSFSYLSQTSTPLP